ncbi:hypothetical protein BGZ75_009747 [Mortierella antarctica]|nr:hypothetical protein BGZ75_009747 [Mortierella antarctica]
MHGSVLFLALATVALGATVRLNTEDTLASASAIASKDRLNPPSLAARSTVVGLDIGNGRRPIEVNIGENKPLITSGGSSILGTNNGAGILGGNTGLLKKRNGSFLGLRRRDGANVVDAAVNAVLNLDHTGSLLDVTQDNGGLLDGLLDINLKRRTDLGAVAQVDLSGQNPTVTVDLSGILGNTRTGAPCAGEGLAAETVGQPANTDATNNNVEGNTMAPSTNVDPNGQPAGANDGNAVTPDVNTQPPVAATDNTNAPAAPINPTQPIITDNTGAAPAVIEVNPIQPIAPVNPISDIVNTNGPIATDSNGGLLDVKVNTNGDDLLQAKVNPNNDGSLLDAGVNTGRDSSVGTDAVDLLAENVNNLGRDSAAAPKGNSLVDLDLLPGNGHVLDLGIHPDPEHLLSANLGPGDNTGVTLKRRLYEIQKRDLGILDTVINTVVASSIDSTNADILNVDLKGKSQGAEVLGAKLLGAKGSNVGDVANVDLKGKSQGVEVLGANVLGTKGSNGSILNRRNRDDDDEDEDDEDDEDEEEEVKESAVKAKDGKDSHPAADSSNDKKEAAKEDPEKHKNSASAGSTSNKMALLGALVGAVFMLA